MSNTQQKSELKGTINQPIFQIFKRKNDELFVVYDDKNKQEICETLVQTVDTILGLESIFSKFLRCIFDGQNTQTEETQEYPS